MKRSLFTILSLFTSIILLSQNQRQLSESYFIQGPWLNYSGELKYSYTVPEGRGRVKNGPLSVTGSDHVVIQNVTLSGSYKLSASCLDGKMHGKITMSSKHHMEERKYYKTETSDCAYTLTGQFSNGLPNGNFKAKAPGLGETDVTYKNGYLVGSYYTKVTILGRNASSSTVVDIKGSLDDKGRMIGKWTISDFSSDSVMDFMNGLRIRLSSKYEETSDDEMAIAKQYATGKLSMDGLKALGYIVKTDSLKLGEYPQEIFFYRYMIDWDKLGAVSFEQSNWVKYNYLSPLPYLKSYEFTEVLESFKKDGKSGYEKYNYKYDESIEEYTINYHRSAKVLSNEQIEGIEKALDEYYRSTAPGIEQFLWNLSSKQRNLWRLPSYDNQVSNGFHLVGKGDEGDKGRFESVKDSLSACNVSIDYLNLFSAIPWEQQSKTDDGQYYVISQNDDISYLSTASVAEVIALKEKLAELSPELSKRAAMQEVKKSLERLLSIYNWKEDCLSRTWDSNRMITDTTMAKATRDLIIERFGKFLPLLNYKIEESVVDGGVLHNTCLFRVLNDKNALTYRVRFDSMDNGYIIVPTLDPEKSEEVGEGVLNEKETALLKAQLEAQKRRVSFSLDKLIGKEKKDFKDASACNKFIVDVGRETLSQDDLKLFKTTFGQYLPLLSHEIEGADREGDVLHCVCLFRVQKGKKAVVYRVRFNALSNGDIIIPSLDTRKSEMIGKEKL